MLKFRSPCKEDVALIRPVISKSGFYGCEFAPASFYIWGEKYKRKLSEFQDFIFFEVESGYSFPVGGGDLTDALHALLKDSEEKSRPVQMFGVTREGCERMEACMPGLFSFEPRRDDWDYIYYSQDLAALSGKKYHSKRNHISKFKRLYSYVYEDITEENAGECLQMAAIWRDKSHKDGNSSDYVQEFEAIRLALTEKSELGLLGGLLRVDGRVIAFTIGEELNPEVFVLHFEKALTEYEGAYAMINHEFASRRLLCYKYINREEDMGLPGLRKAKLSYHPAFLLEKYTASLKV